MSTFVEKAKSSRDWLRGIWDSWRGAFVLAVVLAVFALLAFRYAGDIVKFLNENKDTAQSIAVVVVLVFSAFGLGLVVTFFALFRGIKADEEKLNGIITYCYASSYFRCPPRSCHSWHCR